MALEREESVFEGLSEAQLDYVEERARHELLLEIHPGLDEAIRQVIAELRGELMPEASTVNPVLLQAARRFASIKVQECLTLDERAAFIEAAKAHAAQSTPTEDYTVADFLAASGLSLDFLPAPVNRARWFYLHVTPELPRVWGLRYEPEVKFGAAGPTPGVDPERSKRSRRVRVLRLMEDVSDLFPDPLTYEVQMLRFFQQKFRVLFKHELSRYSFLSADSKRDFLNADSLSALIYAFERYDTEKAAGFRTYLRWWARGFIIRQIGADMELPQSIINQLSQVARFRRAYYKRHDEWPSDKVLEDVLGVDMRVLRTAKYARKIIERQERVSLVNSLRLEELMPVSKETQEGWTLLAGDTGLDQGRLKRAFKGLDEEAQRLLRYAYGFVPGLKVCDDDELAPYLGCREGNVGRIVAAARDELDPRITARRGHGYPGLALDIGYEGRLNRKALLCLSGDELRVLMQFYGLEGERKCKLKAIEGMTEVAAQNALARARKKLKAFVDSDVEWSSEAIEEARLSENWSNLAERLDWDGPFGPEQMACLTPEEQQLLRYAHGLVPGLKTCTLDELEGWNGLGRNGLWHRLRAIEAKLKAALEQGLAEHAALDPAHGFHRLNGVLGGEWPAEVLQEAITHLPQKQPRVIMAHYGLDGSPAQEMTALAEAWGLDRSTVNVTHQRALSNLRILLAQWHTPESAWSALEATVGGTLAPEALNQLTPREREVLDLCFALQGGLAYEIGPAARKLGRGRSGVSRQRSNALKKLSQSAVPALPLAAK